MKWAPNPYSIAQWLSGAPDIEPLYTQSGEEADRFLETHLLSGKSKSVTAALRVFRDVAGIDKGGTGLTLIQAMSSDAVGQAAKEFPQEKIERMLPSLARISDATFDGHLFAEAHQLTVETISFADPRQGDLGDCYLIAAMISLAWTNEERLMTRFSESGFSGRQSEFAWQFHSDTGGTRGRHGVSSRIPMVGKLPRYARSLSRDESWPALLEKAYVAKMRPGGATAEPSPADYQAINEGTSPQFACQALVGGRTEGRDLSLPSGRKVFARRDQFGESGPLFSASGAMVKPTMAWTFDESSTLTPEHWKKTGLFADHAYAVLGFTGDPNLPDHIVLRNPHGIATKVRDGYLRDPHWKPDEREPIKLNENGVFAISHDLFFGNFKNIGWIELD